MDAEWPGFSGGNTNTVSDKLNSPAIFLHLLIAQVLTVEHHGQRISGQCLVCKDVQDRVAAAHAVFSLEIERVSSSKVSGLLHFFASPARPLPRLLVNKLLRGRSADGCDWRIAALIAEQALCEDQRSSSSRPTADLRGQPLRRLVPRVGLYVWLRAFKQKKRTALGEAVL
jgi:hypothetical protein